MEIEISDDQLCNEIDDLLSLESSLQARVAAVRRAKDERKKERIRRGIISREVSDHAIVRYLERCKGFDVEALRQELRSIVDEAAPSVEGGYLWHSSGVGLVLGQDGRVVTVLGIDQIQKWTKQTPGARHEPTRTGSSS